MGEAGRKTAQQALRSAAPARLRSSVAHDGGGERVGGAALEGAQKAQQLPGRAAGGVLQAQGRVCRWDVGVEWAVWSGRRSPNAAPCKSGAVVRLGCIASCAGGADLAGNHLEAALGEGPRLVEAHHADLQRISPAGRGGRGGQRSGRRTSRRPHCGEEQLLATRGGAA
jgi:hypothetical protein